MQEENNDKPILITQVLAKAESDGLQKGFVEDSLKKLTQSGLLYRPRNHLIKITRGGARSDND